MRSNGVPPGPGASPAQSPFAITDDAVGPGDRLDVEPLNARGWKRTVAISAGSQAAEAVNGAAVSGVSHQPMVLRVQWMDDVATVLAQQWVATVRVTVGVDGGKTTVERPLYAWGTALQFPAGAYTVEIVVRASGTGQQPREIFLHASPGFLRDRCQAQTLGPAVVAGTVILPPTFATCCEVSYVGPLGGSFSFTPALTGAGSSVGPPNVASSTIEAQQITVLGSAGGGSATLLWKVYE